MPLKKKIILTILAVFIILCQVVTSYWSFRFIQENEFVLGFSLFLLVPVLALVVVYAYILLKKARNERDHR